MSPPETDRRTLDVTAAVEARLSMGAAGQRLAERDDKHFTGSTAWVARMQRQFASDRSWTYSTWGPFA